MSSTPAATAATTTTTHTYWCYECDMRISIPNPSPIHCPHCLSSSIEPFIPPIPLHLLIHRLSGDDPTLPIHRSGPAPQSSIDSLPTVPIPEPSSLSCAICKDDFSADPSARKLPCSHVYHSDCIVPWLSRHNSCPLCRFRFPGGEGEREREGERIEFGLRVLMRRVGGRGGGDHGDTDGGGGGGQANSGEAGVVSGVGEGGDGSRSRVELI